MATVEELKDVLKEHLEQNGVLNEIRSQIRAQIFNSLNDQPQQPPKSTQENLIINDLIKEYLQFNNYNYSSSVFESECGNPEERLDRGVLTNKLNVVENSQTKKLPLLYSLVFGQKTVYSKPNFAEEPKRESESGKKEDYTYKSIFDVNK